MLAGWTRALGLIAVAALFANAQCYDTCALAAIRLTQTPSNGCHHHRSPHSSNEGDSGCQHQHSEFIGPESAIVKAHVAPAAPVQAVLTAGSVSVVLEPFLVSQPDTGSPPDGHAPSFISVLRI